MANTRLINNLLLLFFATICAAHVIQGSRTLVLFSYIHRAHQSSTSEREFLMQDSIEQWMNRNSRRAMIGSTAPTCTYNECRGCKYKCRAEQVPVEGNDPINSAYHYKCVCHR
ncbi:hypothetical protein ACSBR2_032337 [Camellia fascicularis]